MAVAHDAAAESHTGTTGSASEASFAWTHAPAGTPRGVLVFTFVNANADDATAVSYGASSMTAVTGGRAVDTAGEAGDCKAWFLGSSVPTGNQTVTVTRTNNANVMYAVSITVTAAADTEIKGTPVLLQGDQVVAEQAVDSGADAALRYAGLNTGLLNEPGAGASSTFLLGIDFGIRTIGTVVETTGGTGSRNVGFSVVIEDTAAVHLAIGEVAAAGGRIFALAGEGGGLVGARRGLAG